MKLATSRWQPWGMGMVTMLLSLWAPGCAREQTPWIDPNAKTHLEQAMSYSPSAGTIVWARNYRNPSDDEYVTMPQKLRLGRASSLRAPQCWQSLSRQLTGQERPEWTPLLFMHSLRAPGGENMLVVIELRSLFTGDGFYSPGPELHVVATVVGRGEAGQPIVRYRNDRAGNLRTMQYTLIYSGQVDPADASKFSITYSAQWHSGETRPLLRGQLKDDGTLELTIDYKGG